MVLDSHDIICDIITFMLVGMDVTVHVAVNIGTQCILGAYIGIVENPLNKCIFHSFGACIF